MRLRRLIAAYIDFIVIIFFVTILTDIITFGHFNPTAPLLLLSIFIVMYFILLYFTFISKDLLFKNASLGKKIMGLEIVYNNNEIPSSKILRERNSITLPSFPFEIFNIIIDGYTTGDKKYNTIVQIKKK